MTTIPTENLLKAILELNENGEDAIAARLADFLEISSPAVSMALKRLQNRGQVRVSRDRTVQLTPSGFRVACDLVRRHRLVERLLTDVLKMPWEKVHQEAEKLEHAVSPELEKKLIELFGASGTCPHGSPFTPTYKPQRSSRHFPLNEAPEMAPLRVVRIAELHEKEQPFVDSLAAVRLVPGSPLRLLRKAFDGVIEIEVGERTATFSNRSGSMILVENIAAD